MRSQKRYLKAVARRWPWRSSAATADRTPPLCPPDWHVAPPDFVGVGVQRAGTSWWFDELSRHPDVYRLPDVPKELHFFDSFSNRQLAADDIARYHGWFARPEGGVAGEWTPRYIYDPWVVPQLVEAAPDGRFLVMLRDPIDRFRSGLLFELRRGRSHQDSVVDAYHRGLYASQVARLLRHVARDRVFVLTYEEARASTEEARRNTAEFLGLEPDRFEVATDVRAPKNRRERVSRELPSELMAELADRYRDDIDALARLLPDLDLGRWPTATRS